MIDFSITQADTLVAGLNFQITAAVDNLVVFKKSIVIKEKTFTLIEHFFAKRFPENSDRYKYYHWGENFHNKQQIKDIIKDLNVAKQMVIGTKIKELNYFWLNNHEIVFLEENNLKFANFIDCIIDFLEDNQSGVCVIGV